MTHGWLPGPRSHLRRLLLNSLLHRCLSGFVKMARNRSSLSKWSTVPLDLPSSALTWLNRSWTLVRGSFPLTSLLCLSGPPLRSDQCPSNLPSQEVQFPALSGSSLSIMRGTLIQLGAKMIALKKASEPFNTALTVTVFVEAYKADLAAQEWAQLRKSLNRYLASQLGFGQGFPGSWGAKLMSDSGTTVLIDSEVAVRATLFASIPVASRPTLPSGLSGPRSWIGKAP